MFTLFNGTHRNEFNTISNKAVDAATHVFHFSETLSIKFNLKAISA